MPDWKYGDRLKSVLQKLEDNQRKMAEFANVPFTPVLGLPEASELTLALNEFWTRDQIYKAWVDMAGGMNVKSANIAQLLTQDIKWFERSGTAPVQTGHIDEIGNMSFGSDIDTPANAGFHFFSKAQTYNGESMGAGDFLLGDNTAGAGNILWDESADALYFRTGTVVMSTLATGSVAAAAARVRRSTDQSLSLNSANNAVPVQFDIEEYDDAAFVDLGSNNTRITIPTGYGGRYEVGYYIYLTGASVNVETAIWLNGTAAATSVVGSIGVVDAAGSLLSSGVTDIALVAGDYIELACYVTTGTITATAKGGAYRPVMWARKIR